MANNGGTKMYGVPKWFIRGSWAIGHAGDARTYALIAANADDILADLNGAFDFTYRMREVLDKDGYNTDTDEGPKSYGQNMILAHTSGVWSICTAFSIIEIPDGELWADGAGRAYALGAGYAVTGNADHRIRAAINASIRYCDGCGGEVWMETLK